MNPTISVSEDLNREPGYIIFTVSGVEGNIERLSYSVVRHGYDYNYLGEREWQAAFAWLEPEDAWYESGQLKFVVPPDVTWQMDPQGYVLRLALYPSARELSIDFFWPDVPPAEAARTPDVAHRLSGTKVKPATEAPVIEPQPVVTPKPEPVPAPEPVPEPAPAPPPEPVLAPPEPQAVIEPVSEITPSAKKGPGIGTVVTIVIVLWAALAAVYWFMLRPGDKTVPEQTQQPSAPASNAAVEPPKPEAATEPAAESVPEPVLDPEPIVETKAEPPAPVVTKAQVMQEQGASDTQMPEPAVVQEDAAPAQNSAPRTARASDTDTLNALTEMLGTGASEQPSRTEDDIFNSIEPALRKKVDE